MSFRGYAGPCSSVGRERFGRRVAVRKVDQRKRVEDMLELDAVEPVDASRECLETRTIDGVAGAPAEAIRD